MIRVWVTLLESFRRVLETEWGRESEVIDAIRGAPRATSWQMEAGTAWHKALEADPIIADPHWTNPDELIESGAFSFLAGDVHAAQEAIGPGLWEVPGTRVFDVGGLPVEVSGRLDHVRGLVIQDQKAKFSSADARDYEDSLQWRLYLLIHGGACFRYNLWSFRDPKDGLCELRDVLSFRFWPYAGMEGDCLQLMERFVDWARSRNLLGFLERKDHA